MSNCEAISTHRATLTSLDRALTLVQADVTSNEASVLIGRARSLLRAANQVLASASREEQPTTVLPGADRQAAAGEACA